MIFLLFHLQIIVLGNAGILILSPFDAEIVMLNSFRIHVEDGNVQALRRAMSAFNKYAALGMASFNYTQVCIGM